LEAVTLLVVKSRYVLRSILWGTFGATSLWAFSGSTPWWVGAAFAAFFFGKAALPLFQFVGTLSAKPAELSFARGFRGMAIGYRGGRSYRLGRTLATQLLRFPSRIWRILVRVVLVLDCSPSLER
jgi:hypothetical protein